MADVTAEELQQRYPGLTDAAADTLEKLKNEFFAPDAKWTVADIKQMADGAAEEFREHHPEITEEAIQSLKWCYTFDNR
jgi:hypothetical protein